MSDTPGVSVVIASIVGAPFIDECLESVEQQAKGMGAEVIVVGCGEPEYTERLAKLFPWVKTIHCPGRETVPELRRRGVEAARGEIVAIIEEHCLAAPDWLEQAVEGHASGNYGAVGGPIVDYSYRRLRDWVVYFLEYNGYLPPWRREEVWDLNGANIAYRRAVLIEHHSLLQAGYWEASLHPRLLADGIKFLSLPKMVVHHRGPFNYGYYLQQRYWFSRAFAGSRARTMPLSKRLIYCLAAPVVPFLLLARIAQRVGARRCRMAKFVQSLPLLVPAVTIYVAGECVGYMAGAGDALTKVE